MHWITPSSGAFTAGFVFLLLECSHGQEIIVAPENTTVFSNEQAIFTCETNAADFTSWRINGTSLGNLPTEITDDLSLEHQIAGDNVISRLVIQARVIYNGIQVQCVTGDLGSVPVTSENVTLTIQDFIAKHLCNPVNITLLILDSDIYISWDIEFFNLLGCSFLVTLWNCSTPGTSPCSCTVHASNQHVRRLSLNKCLEKSYSYHNGTIIDIKWENCIEGDQGCSTNIYIPELTETGIISSSMDGLFVDLSNPYCNTDLELSASLLLCFESPLLQDFDGCFDYQLLNEHFYLKQYIVNNSTLLGVKGFDATLINGTVISIFCITESPESCLQSSYIDTNIFNFIIDIPNVCNNCSKSAICEEGNCVCKPGYRGDGIRCDLDAICGNNMSTCEDRLCMCNTGDGICDVKCEDCTRDGICEEKCECDYRDNGMACKTTVAAILTISLTCAFT